MSDNDEAYDPLLPGRRFCLSREDLDAYAELLLEAVPNIRFFRLSFEQEQNAKQRPVLTFHKDFASAKYGQLQIIWSPDTWDPQLILHDRFQEWRYAPFPWPNGTIACSGKVNASFGANQPYMEEGSIYFRCRKGNDEDKRTARKGLRLSTKVASNRRQAMVALPSMKVMKKWDKGRDLWIGHHARQWLLGDPMRITETFGGHGQRAIRPYE